WIAACDQLKIMITAKCAQPAIGLYRKHHSGTCGPVNNNISRAAFSPAAFVDAILEFVVGDDISLNVIESPHLQVIFLMLHQELNNSDILHRTTLKNWLVDSFNEYLNVLASEMAVCFIVMCTVMLVIQIGWITMDNAANNDTFMNHLEHELIRCNIVFDRRLHHI
ncbi:hypothetical protein BDR05DRAFT_842342, partial [Suillus weaverae]